MTHIEMKTLYQKPQAEWEEMYLDRLLCDSSVDSGLDDIVDEPLY